MTDIGFPLLKYETHRSPGQWGESHGESYKTAIHELAAIRRELLFQRCPYLIGEKLAQECFVQWETTKRLLPLQFDELEGIRTGAGLSIEDIVILNAYTDIRDIPNFDDQGCSSFLTSHKGGMLGGQTWDMHASAKNYLCVLDVPEHKDRYSGAIVPKQFIYTLVGTVALMGFNSYGEMLAVNNLNTSNAKSAVIWPAFARALLSQKGLAPKKKMIENITLTSARCFMLANKNEGAQVWEIFPQKKIVQDYVLQGESKILFHTNHCLNKETQALEAAHSQASTTHDRFALIDKKKNSVGSLTDLVALFQDHENYPKSICSHFQSGAVDPSHTCGGAATDFNTGEIVMWRGCPTYEKSTYKISRFKF